MQCQTLFVLQGNLNAIKHRKSKFWKTEFLVVARTLHPVKTEIKCLNTRLKCICYSSEMVCKWHVLFLHGSIVSVSNIVCSFLFFSLCNANTYICILYKSGWPHVLEILEKSWIFFWPGKILEIDSDFPIFQGTFCNSWKF